MIWFQITAGHGPIECAWAVIRVLEKMQQEAAAEGLDFRLLEVEPGAAAGTAQSALVAISEDAEAFANKWRGTVQWIARSPFRPQHKRKNWFVGVEILRPAEESQFNPKDVRWETMCASGPGGQHVNRTESAVRVTHIPTGLQATAMDERSQFRNRKLALARLAQKVADRGEQQRAQARETRWRAHQDLERGNPLRTFRADS